MGSKFVTDVQVGAQETEIIESTQTDPMVNRNFNVDNGENEIIATAWGSENGINWIQIDSKTISANETGILVVGPDHTIYVKLTGRTTLQTATSIVNSQLTW